MQKNKILKNYNYQTLICAYYHAVNIPTYAVNKK